MNKIYTINNKDIYDINTTVLYSSNYNYTKDAIEFINKGCSVIDKINRNSISEIPLQTLIDFDCVYLNDINIFTKADDIKINILSNLSNDTFVFLNILTYLDDEFKNKIISYLIKNNKRIINYTSEIEETLLFDYLVVIDNDKIIMEGVTKNILKEEKILKLLGFDLPTIVELSNGLKLYNIIEETYYNKESLVDALWK